MKTIQLLISATVTQSSQGDSEEVVPSTPIQPPVNNEEVVLTSVQPEINDQKLEEVLHSSFSEESAAPSSQQSQGSANKPIVPLPTEVHVTANEVGDLAKPV